MNRKKSSQKLLRISEAAELLGINPMTLRRWDKRGILKPVRIGPRRDRRYRKADILKILNTRSDK